MTKSLDARRRDHAKRRLSEIRALIPDMPAGALSQATLRQLSFHARRVRGVLQSTLLQCGNTNDGQPASTSNASGEQSAKNSDNPGGNPACAFK